MVILNNEVLLESPADRRAGAQANGWAGKDPRKLLRAAFHVSSLDAAVQFYHRHFGLLMLRKLDLPDEPVQRALVAAGTSEPDCFCLELLCRESPEDGSCSSAAPPQQPQQQPQQQWLTHFTVVVPNSPAVVEAMRTEGNGALILEELAAVISIHSHGGSKQDKVCMVRDPDGWTWKLLELHGKRARERLCAVGIRVSSLAASLAWYQNTLGMRVLQSYESPGTGHLSALLGYTEELEGPLLELRQSGDQPLPDPGEAFSWFVVGTADLSRTMVNLEVAGERWDKIELPSTDNPTESVDAAIVSDPDGWRFCLVQLPLKDGELAPMQEEGEAVDAPAGS